MRRRKWLVFVLFFTLFLLFCVFFFQGRGRYHSYVVSQKRWNRIQKNRNEKHNFTLKEIKFNDFPLLVDEENKKMYYSQMASFQKNNPVIEFYDKEFKIVFRDKLNDSRISKNQSIPVMIYNDSYYQVYDLIVTTLPIINIDYNSFNDDKNVPMKITIFDNHPKAFHKVSTSSGNIDIIKNESEKYNYQVSFHQKSLGRNVRQNPVSILCMQKHSNYYLNSLGSDSEKIRNVFSTNLWNQMNEDSLDNLQYVEVFMNHQYFGLYSFGPGIKNDEYSYQHGDYSFIKENLTSSDEKILDRYRIVNRTFERDCPQCDEEDAWNVLNQFLQDIHSSDRKKLKYWIQNSNAVDLYLFYLFTQASDHVDSNSFLNTILSFQNKNQSYELLFTPWSLNDTFHYHQSSNIQDLMRDNPIYTLIQNEDEDTIQELKKRYHLLRKNIWSNQSIKSMLTQYENQLFSSGAYQRDFLKWGSSDIPDYSKEKLNSFLEYVLERIVAMDQYVDQL